MTKAETESYKVTNPRPKFYRAERDGVVRFGLTSQHAVTACHKAWHAKIREERSERTPRKHARA